MKIREAFDANRQKVMTAPQEFLWAMIAINPDGTEGIMGEMDIVTGQAVPWICGKEQHIPHIVAKAKQSPILKGVRVRLIKYTRGEVLEEFDI
jgi:hypothetical protein